MADNVTSPTRSRWGFSNPSKGLIEYQVKEGQKQQLLSQAASLVPDYSKLSEALMQNEMHFADQQRMKNLLDTVTQGYMENYNRNPFYSFSRDARNLTRTMFHIVNNPTIKQLSQQFEYDRARWEEGRKDGLISNYDVNENGVLVGTPVRDEAGNVVDYKVTRKRAVEQGDTPLTLNDTYQYITKRAGGQYGGFNYEMSTDQELLNNLDKSFQNLGEDKIKRDILEEGREIASSNNRRQIIARVNWLLNNGLSKADLNNLYSRYFKQTGDFNMDNARKFAVKYIADYAEGIHNPVTESQYFNDVRKAAVGGAGGGSEKEAQIPVTYSTAFQGAGVPQLSMIQTTDGAKILAEGRVIAGIIQPGESRKVKDLPVLREIIASGGYIMNQVDDRESGIHNGDFVRMPNIAFEDMVISDRAEQAPKMTILPVDKDGNPANANDIVEIGAVLEQERPVPARLRKYFRQATAKDVSDGLAQRPGDPILNQAYFTHVTAQLPQRRWRTGIGGTKGPDEEITEVLNKYGYTSIDDNRLRDSYNQGVGEEVAEHRIIGFDDRIYEVDLFIPVTNTEPFMQDKVRGTTDALLLGDSSRLRDPSRPVSRAYFGLEPYNMVKMKDSFSTFEQWKKK